MSRQLGVEPGGRSVVGVHVATLPAAHGARLTDLLRCLDVGNQDLIAGRLEPGQQNPGCGCSFARGLSTEIDQER